MQKLYVVPEIALKNDMIPYIKKESQYNLQCLDYPKYGKTGISEQCSMLGIENYDCSIPQSWYAKFYKTTGMNPAGNIIWSYDEFKFGSPVAITREGKVALDIFNHITKISLED